MIKSGGLKVNVLALLLGSWAAKVSMLLCPSARQQKAAQVSKRRETAAEQTDGSAGA